MSRPVRKVLVTGAGGRVGRPLCAALRSSGLEVVGAGRAALDVTDGRAVDGLVAATVPDVVVNLAAWTDVDACEADPARARRVNADAVDVLATACRRRSAHLVQLSTDYVFAGELDRPYREGDPTGPISVYGRTKLAGEEAAGARSTVIRTAWLSSVDGPCFVRTVLDLAADPERPLVFVADQVGSPTCVDDLVRTTVALVADPPPGVVHVANQGRVSWFDVARRVLAACGGDPERVRPTGRAAFARPGSAPRPASSALASVVLGPLGMPEPGPWEEAFDALARRIARREGAPTPDRAPAGPRNPPG